MELNSTGDTTMGIHLLAELASASVPDSPPKLPPIASLLAAIDCWDSSHSSVHKRFNIPPLQIPSSSVAAADSIDLIRSSAAYSFPSSSSSTASMGHHLYNQPSISTATTTNGKSSKSSSDINRPWLGKCEHPDEQFRDNNHSNMNEELTSPSTATTSPDIEPRHSDAHSSASATAASAASRRKRRRYDEIVRVYRCNWGNCNKSYGTLNHLNHHITLQNHGPKRLPEEVKQLRLWLKANKQQLNSGLLASPVVPDIASNQSSPGSPDDMMLSSESSRRILPSPYINPVSASTNTARHSTVSIVNSQRQLAPRPTVLTSAQYLQAQNQRPSSSSSSLGLHIPASSKNISTNNQAFSSKFASSEQDDNHNSNNSNRLLKIQPVAAVYPSPQDDVPSTRL